MGRLDWEDRIKFNSTYKGLNEQLTKALFLITILDDNYTPFVNQVRVIAGKIGENRCARACITMILIMWC